MVSLTNQLSKTIRFPIRKSNFEIRNSSCLLLSAFCLLDPRMRAQFNLIEAAKSAAVSGGFVSTPFCEPSIRHGEEMVRKDRGARIQGRRAACQPLLVIEPLRRDLFAPPGRFRLHVQVTPVRIEENIDSRNATDHLQSPTLNSLFEVCTVDLAA